MLPEIGSIDFMILRLTTVHENARSAFGTVIFMAEVSLSPLLAGSGDRRTPLRLFTPEMG
jgi:hypothetical protein